MKPVPPFAPDAAGDLARVAGAAELVGAGVHVSVPDPLPDGLEGRDAVVAGSPSAAGEVAQRLARVCRTVWVVGEGAVCPSLPGVRCRPRLDVVAAAGVGRLEAVVLRDRGTGRVGAVEAVALFHIAETEEKRTMTAHAHCAPVPGGPTGHDHTPLVPTGGAEVVVELEAREADWIIAPERPALPAWAYGGEVPGPTLEAKVGDTLVVRLTNRLDEPTTIHWHGLRLPAPMDGTADVQRPVFPGETFEYRFPLPDAGTFWYHPHQNETEQIERGLHGVLVVRGPDEPVVDAERVVVLDDVRLDRRGGFAGFGGWKQRHDGREGGVLLLNGREDPVIETPAGQVERWRVVNVANARYVRLSLGGRPFRVIGSDGGLIERPFETAEVLLAPADRVDLIVGPLAEGERLEVDALPYDRGLGEKGTSGRFGTIVAGPARPSRAVVPERLRAIEPLASGDAVPTRLVRLGGKMSLRRGVDFLVNGERHHKGEAVRVGELQVWDLVNDTMLDHPFHLHGFFFQVLEVDGRAPAYRSWEDTINVRRKGRVKIAWVADDRPGPWMYHCHILEHHEAGMMAHFNVER